MSGMLNEPPISINSPREVGYFLAQRERVQHQQHRSSIVVDHRRGRCAGEATERGLHVLVSIAALASFEIELDVARFAALRR